MIRMMKEPGGKLTPKEEDAIDDDECNRWPEGMRGTDILVVTSIDWITVMTRMMNRKKVLFWLLMLVIEVIPLVGKNDKWLTLILSSLLSSFCLFCVVFTNAWSRDVMTMMMTMMVGQRREKTLGILDVNLDRKGLFVLWLDDWGDCCLWQSSGLLSFPWHPYPCQLLFVLFSKELITRRSLLW